MKKENQKKKKILIIGSGPYSIGSSVEFDWCGVQVLRTLRKLGYETIFINSNPETVSTDYDECDRLYFEELTVERILDICDKEKPSGVIFSTGGQIAQNMAMELANEGLPLLGTPVQSIDDCEDRGKFSTLCDELGIDQPKWESFKTKMGALQFAKKEGFPVLVRPSFVLSGAAMAVATNEKDLSDYLDTAVGTSRASVVISKFEENAKEIECDAVAQNGEIICSAISEHIENAGVHSGDATIVLPAQDLRLETVRRVRRIAQKLAQKLRISGPFNIQFLARENEIKVIECNLRASRSFPFSSKVLGQNFIEIATRIWVGEKLRPQEINPLEIRSVGVKAAQFSFSRLKGADPVLGVEMSSTGEVACFGDTVEEAFLKSLVSVGFIIPKPKSKILVTIGKLKDKVVFLPVAQRLADLGFSFFGTAGTSDFLNENKISCKKVYKISSGKHPNVADIIEKKEVSLVINTSNKFSHEEVSDGYLIRRKAIDRNIPLISNLQMAKLLARSLAQFPTEDALPVFDYEERLNRM
ncbi:ATP-grasp domain-containing protein [Candidatus Gracilibacteria bacterium]|nr:ATP-grasp domain-containing protein [Candidatus Gracilibacteria bacterium]